MFGFNEKPKAAAQEVEPVDPKQVAMLKEAIAYAALTEEEKALIDTPEKLDDMTKRVLGYLRAHDIPLTDEFVQSPEFSDALGGAFKVTPPVEGYMVTDQKGTVLGVRPTKADAEGMIREEKLGRGREGGGADA